MTLIKFWYDILNGYFKFQHFLTEIGTLSQSMKSLKKEIAEQPTETLLLDRLSKMEESEEEKGKKKSKKGKKGAEKEAKSEDEKVNN